MSTPERAELRWAVDAVPFHHGTIDAEARERLLHRGPTIVRPLLSGAAKEAKRWGPHVIGDFRPHATSIGHFGDNGGGDPLVRLINTTTLLTTELARTHQELFAAELFNCFADEDPDVRVLATLSCAIPHVPEHRVLGPVRLLGSTDGDPLVKIAVCVALSNLEKTDEPTRRDIERTIEWFAQNGTGSAVRTWATEENGLGVTGMIWGVVATR